MAGGRPKEYKNRIHFGSSMDLETYTTLRKLCAVNNIEINSIFQDAADDFIKAYGDGAALPRREPELPTIHANRDELLAWANKVGPDGSRKALDNLAFLHKKLAEQMRAIELSWRERQTKVQDASIKVP